MPARGGTVVVGVLGEPETLDPFSPRASDLTYALVRPVYRSPYRFLPTGATEPDLAAGLETSGDTAVLDLAPARFSNGRPVTARDLAASIRRAAPPSGLARITGHRVLGRRTIRLRAPGRPEWEALLATGAFVLHRGRPGPASGPYRMEGRVPGLEIRYRRNPRYAEPGLLDGFVVRHAASLDVLLGLLQRGKVDAAALPSAVNLAARLDEIGVAHDQALGWERIVVDLSGAGYERDRVAALTKVIDPHRIERGFVRAAGRVADSLAPGPGPGGADGPFERMRRGTTTLDGAIRIAAPVGDELVEQIQRLIQVQLDVAGMKVELVNIDPGRFYGSWAASDPFPAALRRLAGAPDMPPPADAIPLLHVATFVAWGPGVVGPRANPTLEGPLFNVERWHVVER